MGKKFVAVRTAYYKKSAAERISGHIFRVGEHAKNENVTFPEMSGMNKYKSIHSLDDIEAKHKEAIGKNPRKDRNAVFEHVLVFSEEHFNKYGPTRHEEYIEDYMKSIKDNFGFEPMGYAIHMDEGHICPETGLKKINTHCQILFYNFDFDKKKAPLRDLMIKGKDENGVTNKLNPNFVKMQDLAAKSFEPLGYERGISDPTKKHIPKWKFIQKTLMNSIESLQQEEKSVKERLNAIGKNFGRKLFAYTKALLSKATIDVQAEAAEKVVDTIDEIIQPPIKKEVEKVAIEYDQEINGTELQSQLDDNQDATEKRQRRRRKRKTKAKKD